MLHLYYVAPQKAQQPFKSKYDYETVLPEQSGSLSNTERAWLNRAVKLAKTSKERHRHACIIVRGGSIQGFGINKRRNMPGIIHDLDALGEHAEVNAIKRTVRTDGATAFIARINGLGIPKMSKPCPDCINALKNAGVRRVIYTIDNAIDLE